MKTFRWTIPEPGLSVAENREHAAYPEARKQSLSSREQKFLLKWGAERTLGRRAFRRKMLLVSCLGLSLITGGFLLLKLLGFIESGVSLFTSAMMFSLIASAVSSLPSWETNEKRYKALMDKLE